MFRAALPVLLGDKKRKREFCGIVDMNYVARHAATMRSTIFLLPFLLGGCGNPDTPEAASYLTLASDGTVQGWNAFKALDVQLPPAEHARITTAAPIGMGPRFFVALRGSCAGNAALVDHVRTIVARQGVAAVTCGMTSPDHQ